MIIPTTVYYLYCDNMPNLGCPEYFVDETKELVINYAQSKGWLIESKVQLCPSCRKLKRKS